MNLPPSAIDNDLNAMRRQSRRDAHKVWRLNPSDPRRKAVNQQYSSGAYQATVGRLQLLKYANDLGRTDPNALMNNTGQGKLLRDSYRSLEKHAASIPKTATIQNAERIFDDAPSPQQYMTNGVSYLRPQRIAQTSNPTTKFPRPDYRRKAKTLDALR